MFRCIKFLKGYYKESIIAPLFKMIEATFELIIPLITARIIDEGIKNRDTALILKMGGWLVLLGVLGLACSLIAQFFAAKAAMGFGKAVRSELFKRINSFSHKQIDTIGTPTLINRITADTTQAQTGVNMFLRLFLRSPFIVLGAVVMAFSINKNLTLIFIGAVLAIGVIIYLIMHCTTPRFKKVQGKLDIVARLMRENLSGVRVVRAFSKQESEIENFSSENVVVEKMQCAVGKISALLNPLTYVAINLSIIFVIYFGGHAVDLGVNTQGDITALVNYLTQILIALLALGNLVVILSKGAASISRVMEILDTPADITDGDGEISENGENAVEFKNVFFSYSDSGDDALSNISFASKKGETVGVIGGTGDGKSTLINLIARFYDIKSGEIKVFGVPVKDYKLNDLRDRIGFVPQKAMLFNASIRDNLRWGNENATDEELLKAAETAQALDFVLDKGLDFEIEEGGKNLSGGQRQRLTIARALVKNPEILILDDSASALDYATDLKLRRAIKESTKDTTVFIVSQRVSAVRDADNILVLDDGEIVGIGKHNELLESCEVYKEICSSQLSEVQ